MTDSTGDTPLVRDIRDTARWVAMYRAVESERPDAIFRDPYARRLAGARGEAIYRNMPQAYKTNWPFIARTWIFDQYVAAQVASGVRTVLNLAAGLDTRPYRMALPADLHWVEVDNAELLAEKTRVLAGERAACDVERVPMDLADGDARRALFRRVGSGPGPVMVLTEGLLPYLTDAQVAELARDLAAEPAFRSWATDLMSPALLPYLEKGWGKELRKAGAPLQFAPMTGPSWFEQFGWKPVEVRSAMHTAAHLHRLPWSLRLFALIPGGSRFHPRRPWSASCLLERVR